MRLVFVLSAIAISCAPVSAWELPPDNGTMSHETIQAIVKGNDYPETSSYRQEVDFIDFSHAAQGGKAAL